MRSRSGTILTAVLVLLAVPAVGLAHPPPTLSAPHASRSPAPGGFRLTAHDGRIVTATALRGRWLLVFFGYTRCTDACPATLARIGAVLARLGPLAERIQPLFITVDPERDTPPVLARFLAAFDGRILGLTGSPEAVAAAVDGYRVYVRKASADHVPIDHTALIYVVGPDGRFVTFFSDNFDVDAAVARLRDLVAGGRPGLAGSRRRPRAAVSVASSIGRSRPPAPRAATSIKRMHPADESKQIGQRCACARRVA